jgi:predicted DNA-binding protein YlxM (UPF0122 family)
VKIFKTRTISREGRMSKIPPKEKLIELYLYKNLTTYEIAEIFNVNRTSVRKWLKKYDISINPKQRKYEQVKKVPLTKQQREMIIGTLLGDGLVGEHGRKNKSCRIHIAHCDKQKSLVLDKKAVLGNLVNTISKRTKCNSTMWSFVSVVHNDFKFFRKLFYKNGKKVIRRELEYHITRRSLAYWIMDDGSCGKCNMRLHTSGFSFEENLILQSILKIKFGIKCKVCEYKRNDNIYYYLSFNKRNSQILSDLVRIYILDYFKYKILPPSTTKRQTL